MIKENNVSKYFLYAIGEIILVVIGILIALQINNWNENKRDRGKELFFLQKLTSNLNDDIISFKDIMYADSLIIQDLNKSSEEILSAQTSDDISFDNNSRFRYLIFLPNTTVYDNLTSSGQIGLIKNDLIIDELILYYKAIEQINKGTDESLKNYSREIESFYMRFDHRRNEDILPKRNIEEYRNEPFILNSLYYKTGLLKIQVNNYKNLLKKSELLLENVKYEIDKLKKQ